MCYFENFSSSLFSTFQITFHSILEIYYNEKLFDQFLSADATVAQNYSGMMNVLCQQVQFGREGIRKVTKEILTQAAITFRFQAQAYYLISQPFMLLSVAITIFFLYHRAKVLPKGKVKTFLKILHTIVVIVVVNNVVCRPQGSNPTASACDSEAIVISYKNLIWTLVLQNILIFCSQFTHTTDFPLQSLSYIDNDMYGCIQFDLFRVSYQLV